MKKLLCITVGSLLISACAWWPQAPSQPFAQSPDELPYYDAAWAQSLSLADMNLQIVGRDQVDAYDILDLRFSAFDQPVAGPDGVVTIRWRQRGTLVLPPAPLASDKALAFSIHDASPGSKDSHRSFLGMSLDIARAYGIPVLVHGWVEDVAQEVDGVIFHATQDKVMRRLLATGITRAEDLPMDGRYLFNGNPLAKADMVALTALQRLVERERGGQVTELASMGGSKEGHSHWIIGALDDRITVLAPGGLYWHDTAEILKHYERDWGWQFPWEGGQDSGFDGLRSLFSTVWRLGDWILDTPAGALVARTTMDPASWYDKIRARHVVVFGDLGLTPGQHDGPWPFWAENVPLGGFEHPSWRYVRMYDGSGAFMDEAGVGEMGLSLLPQMAELLVHDVTSPSDLDYSLQTHDDGRVTLELSAQLAGDWPSEAVALYAVSPERGLRDRKYWHTATMQAVGAGRWAWTFAAPPQDHGLAIIAVVRQRVQRGALSFWRSASTLPIEAIAVPELPPSPGPRWDQLEAELAAPADTH